MRQSLSLHVYLAAGAKGYLSKRCAPRELIMAIRRVFKGGSFITTQIIREMSKIPGG